MKKFWTRLSSHLPLALLLLLNATIASTEFLVEGPALNDSSLHLHQVRQMETARLAGQSMIDFWDPTIGLGYPFMRTYSWLTHLLLWSAHHLFGASLSLERLYGLFVFLAWSLWPAALYKGLRLLEIDRLEALAAAWICPFLHAGFRFGISLETYGWNAYGLLPNLLGLCLFPLALGYGMAFIRSGRRFTPALVCMFLTWFAHLMTGFFAAMAVALWTLGDAARQRQAIGVKRFIALGSASVGCCLFFLLPYLQDGPYINKTRMEPDYYWDSYPASEILVETLKGNLLDQGALFPLFSLAALLGLVLAWRRKVSGLPACLFAVFLVFYLGREPWNLAVSLLPMGQKLALERFIVPTQFFAILLAGQGLAAVFRRLKARFSHGMAWLLLGLLLCYPIGRKARHNLIQAPQTKRLAHGAQSALKPALKPVFSLLNRNWDGTRLLVPRSREVSLAGVGYYQIPMMADLAHVGNLWHAMSCNSDFLYLLDPERVDHWQLFAIRYGLSPPDYWPKAPLNSLNRDESFEFSELSQAVSLFDFGTVVRVLDGTSQDHYQATADWLASDLPGRGLYLGFGDGFPSTVPARQRSDPRRGFSMQGPRALEDGHFGYELQVTNTRQGHLIGKFTYHPGWRAEVDGLAVPIVAVSPAFVGLALAPGRHHVKLFYQNSSWTKPLILFTLFFLAGSLLSQVPQKKQKSVSHFIKGFRFNTRQDTRD